MACKPKDEVCKTVSFSMVSFPSSEWEQALWHGWTLESWLPDPGLQQQGSDSVFSLGSSPTHSTTQPTAEGRETPGFQGPLPSQTLNWHRPGQTFAPRNISAMHRSLCILLFNITETFLHAFCSGYGQKQGSCFCLPPWPPNPRKQWVKQQGTEI